MSQTPVYLSAEATLAAGWYRFRLRIRSRDHFSVQKRVEITFDGDSPTGKAVATDTLTWNRTLDVGFMIELPRDAARLTLKLFHATDGFTLEHLSLTRVPRPLLGLTAVAEKLKLITAYHCLRPVLWRGGGLLVRGRFGEFGRKVLKGLRDSRLMRPGAYKGSEVDGGWWRRNTLNPKEAEAVRAAIDVMPAPPPVAVLVPVDPHKFDETRAAAHSVRRQLYPHWELLLACAGPHWLHPHLATVIGSDPRVKVTLVEEEDGLGVAIARSLSDTGCERVVVLSPATELAEDALYRFVELGLSEPEADAISTPIYDAMASAVQGESTRGGEVWLTRTDRLPDDFPEVVTAASLSEWVMSGVPEPARKPLDRTLAFPVRETPLVDRSRIGEPTPAFGSPLVIAADLRGITGWDHVTYAVLRGLPSVGAKLARHPTAYMDADLIPPAFLPPLRKRRSTDPVLAISPPFLVHRFEPDARTAVFTMWETDTLTGRDVAKLNAAGLVIVPSRWQVECFRRSGVTVPIEVAPLGFDPLVFHDDGTAPEVCTFGTAGALVAGGIRKNAQRMIDLFRQAFPTERDVRLRVKISPTSPEVETYDDPRVDLIRAVLPHTQLADWYRSLTAYVNGSFGEGFGLHLIEAMACGRPLITTNYSGLTAFFDPSVGYAVGHTLVPVENDVYTGRWAEPSDSSIVARMREVYSNPEVARRLGRRSASRATLFSWKASGRKLAAALGKHGFLHTGCHE